MRQLPLGILRALVLVLGFMAGLLLVQALDESFARAPRPLITVGHLVFGFLLGAVLMPGPILGLFVTPDTTESFRGLAVGGSVVTAFAAVLGGVFLLRAAPASAAGEDNRILALAWCAMALPLAVVDGLRLRGGPGRGR